MSQSATASRVQQIFHIYGILLKGWTFFRAIFCHMDLAVFRNHGIWRQRRILGSVHLFTDPDPAFEMPTKNNFLK
jgi:hypothetical protein